ncbi:MAG: polysaccharide deacetylase family protein [Chlorobi bacterium]|nr:polysaccharide deacetylase family protein [Chlorobiota bacterium]
MLVHPPKVIKNVFSNITWNINSDKKVVYLTFDDGPIPDITEKILLALDIFDAKATFFCVGENVKRYPHIYKKILDSGHTAGNHTFSHMNGLKSGTEEYIDNIEKASKYINSKLFRPPHGRMKSSQQILIEKEYNIILWDVLSYDFNKKLNKITCFNNVKHFTRPGSIVVFHDNIKASNNMFYALTQTLLLYKEAGYKFEALTEAVIKNQIPLPVKKSKIFTGFF